MMYEEMHGIPERPADATRKFREVITELKEIPKDVDGVWDPRMDKAIGRAICLVEEVETLLKNYWGRQDWGAAWRAHALKYYDRLEDLKA